VGPEPPVGKSELGFDPWPRWREIMGQATRHGKLTKEKVAKLLERESPGFIRWAVGDDEELRRMMEAAPVAASAQMELG